jgi:hypothetical protein
VNAEPGNGITYRARLHKHLLRRSSLRNFQATVGWPIVVSLANGSSRLTPSLRLVCSQELDSLPPLIHPARIFTDYLQVLVRLGEECKVFCSCVLPWRARSPPVDKLSTRNTSVAYTRPGTHNFSRLRAQNSASSLSEQTRDWLTLLLRIRPD